MRESLEEARRRRLRLVPVVVYAGEVVGPAVCVWSVVVRSYSYGGTRYSTSLLHEYSTYSTYVYEVRVREFM